MAFRTGYSKDDVPCITVDGNAEVNVVPDYALLSFSIVSREETLDGAVADNTSKISSVIDFLKSSDVDSRHIRTDLMRIQPLLRDHFQQGAAEAEVQNKMIPYGYKVQRGLTVKVTNLEHFEDISGGLIKQGVNNVGGVKFHTSELREHRDIARLQACRFAKEKAQAMAEALGASLGPVLSITEQRCHDGDFRLQQSQLSCNAEGSTGAGTGTGEISVKAEVHVVFRLETNAAGYAKA